MYRRAVMGILRNNDRYLIVHKVGAHDGDWYFMGGGVEEGETPVEALRREVNEELNLDPSMLAQIQIMTTTYKYDWGEELEKSTGYRGQEQTILVADVTTDSFNLPEDDELDGYKWCTIDEVERIIPHQDFVDTFNKVLEELTLT